MPLLTSTIDPGSDTYGQNRAAMEAALAVVEAQLAVARSGGGARYVERHRSRGKMLAHERVELLLDRDSPFLEIAPLAAWGTDYTVGASLVSGIGVVSGVECLVSANDPTVRGGATNPFTMRKSSRLADIALENRLPSISLVESGGADLPTQSEIFIPGGRGFRDLTQRSAAAVPTIALVFGNSTAGGAYVPGMSDHIVMIEGRSKVFLGGPPLVKMATGEESDDEELGGASMHARVSGLADYLATDETDAIRIGRAIVSRLNRHKLGPAPSLPADDPVHDPDELLGIASADRASSRAGRPSTATPSGCSPTTGACCSARRPTRPPNSSSSATRPTCRCCSSRTRRGTWWARSTNSAASSKTAPR
jgi:acetyl-CoA carboxylase carboxyltransferase component